MFDSNQIILEFISKNWIAIMVTINTLQGIAWLTPSIKDDKVVTLIKQTFESIRNIRSSDKESVKEPVKDSNEKQESFYEYTDSAKEK